VVVRAGNAEVRDALLGEVETEEEVMTILVDVNNSDELVWLSMGTEIDEDDNELIGDPDDTERLSAPIDEISGVDEECSQI
jgi:hypothetical protein